MVGQLREGSVKPWHGRLLFWRGGHVWIGRVTSETGFHEHHAIQITLALGGGEVRFREPDQNWTAYSAAIVTANKSHAFEARDALVALIFAEPESRAGRALTERYRGGVRALDANSLATFMARLENACLQGGSAEELVICARDVIANLSSIEPAPVKALDSRIERAIATVRERLGDAITLAEIADTVHLSPERFRHLFLQETGIRFRPYVLWLRMEVACAAYAAGASLTEASHVGGFADSAHFSRTFKRMFGVTAIDVRRA